MRYIEKLADEPGKAALAGTLMHKQIEDYVNGTASAEVLQPRLHPYIQFFDDIRHAGGKVEVPFHIDRGWRSVAPDSPDVWIRGFIDSLAVQGAKATLYDWKSGKEYDDHYEQKEIYSLGTAAEYPQVSEVWAYHVYIDHGKNTCRVYSVDEMQPMRERWHRRFEVLETATEFHPNPNFGCRYCSFSKKVGGPCKF